MTTSADFTLNGTPASDGVYRATKGSTVTLALVDGLLIDAGVVKVTLERKTKSATDIPEIASEYVLSPATATLDLSIPHEVSSWLIRVQVNGGSSPRGVEPTWTRERVIETVGDAGVAKQLAGERTERHPERGWSDIQNDMVDAADRAAAGLAALPSPDPLAGITVSHEWRADIGVEHGYRVSRWVDRRGHVHLGRIICDPLTSSPRPPLFDPEDGAEVLPRLLFPGALGAMAAAITSDVFSLAFRVKFPDADVVLLSCGQCPPGSEPHPDGTSVIIGANYTAGADTSITASLSDDAFTAPVVASMTATHSAWHNVIVRSTGSTIRVRVDGTNGATANTAGLGALTMLDTIAIGCVIDGSDGLASETFDDGSLRHVIIADGDDWTDAECLTIEAALTAAWT